MIGSPAQVTGERKDRQRKRGVQEVQRIARPAAAQRSQDARDHRAHDQNELGQDQPIQPWLGRAPGQRPDTGQRQRTCDGDRAECSEGVMHHAWWGPRDGELGQ